MNHDVGGKKYFDAAKGKRIWTLNAAPKPSRKPMEASEDFAQLRLRFTNLIQHSFEVILLLGLLGVAISSSFHRFLLPRRMPKLSTHQYNLPLHLKI